MAKKKKEQEKKLLKKIEAGKGKKYAAKTNQSYKSVKKAASKPAPKKPAPKKPAPKPVARKPAPKKPAPKPVARKPAPRKPAPKKSALGNTLRSAGKQIKSGTRKEAKRIAKRGASAKKIAKKTGINKNKAKRLDKKFDAPKPKANKPKANKPEADKPKTTTANKPKQVRRAKRVGKALARRGATAKRIQKVTGVSQKKAEKFDKKFDKGDYKKTKKVKNKRPGVGQFRMVKKKDPQRKKDEKLISKFKESGKKISQNTKAEENNRVQVKKKDDIYENQDKILSQYQQTPTAQGPDFSYQAPNFDNQDFGFQDFGYEDYGFQDFQSGSTQPSGGGGTVAQPTYDFTQGSGGDITPVSEPSYNYNVSTYQPSSVDSSYGNVNSGGDLTPTAGDVAGDMGGFPEMSIQGGIGSAVGASATGLRRRRSRAYQSGNTALGTQQFNRQLRIGNLNFA